MLNDTILLFKDLETCIQQQQVDTKLIYPTLFRLLYKWKITPLKDKDLDFASVNPSFAIKILTEINIFAINSAISQFVKNKHYLQYEMLYLLLIGEKQNYSLISFSKYTKRKFDFEPDQHIIDHPALLAKLKKAKPNIVQQVYDLLKTHLPDKTAVKQVVTAQRYELPTKKVAESIPENYTLIKTASSLIPYDILGQRANHHYSRFYWKRKGIDNLLQLAIQQKQSVLLSGAALAGKSRAVLEVLQKTMKVKVLIPNIHKIKAQMPLPEQLGNYKLVVFIDHLQDYFRYHQSQQERINKMLHYYLQKGVTIIATSLDGLELQALQAMMEEKVWRQFEQIHIPPIVHEEIFDHLSDSDQRLDFDAFDGSVGSLLMGITNAAKNYIALPNKAPVAASIIYGALETFKSLYLTSNSYGYRPIFENNVAKEFCIRHMSKKLGQKKWDDTLAFLANKGYCEVKENQIIVEKAWLLHAVAPHYEAHQIRQEVNRIYHNVSERKRNGFYNKSFDYLISLLKSKDFRDGEAVFESMQKAGVKPNTVICNELLQKAATFKEGKSILEWMETKKVKRSIHTFNRLIPHANWFEQGWALYEQMGKEKIKANLETFNHLLGITDNYPQAQQVFEALLAQKITANTTTINLLLAQSPDFATSNELLQLMQEKGLRPNIESFNLLIQQAQNMEQSLSLLQLIRDFELSPTTKTYQQLIPKTNHFAEAIQLLDNIQTQDLDIDQPLLLLLVDKIQTTEEVNQFLNITQNAAIALDASVYESLIQKTTKYETALELFEAIEAAKVIPNTAIYNHLIQLAPSETTAQDYFQKMQDQAIPANIDTYHLLISQAADYSSAHNRFEELQKAHFDPTGQTFELLLQKTTDYSTIIDLLQRLKQLHLPMGKDLCLIVKQQLGTNAPAFVNHLIKFHPQVLNDQEYHQLFILLLDQLDLEAFFKQTAEYIYTSDALIMAYARQLIDLESFRWATRILEELQDKTEEYYLLKDELPFNF